MTRVHAPRHEFEAHFYQLVKKLPKSVVMEALEGRITEDEYAKVLARAKAGAGRRPITLQSICSLRRVLLDHLDESDDHLNAALEYRR